MLERNHGCSWKTDVSTLMCVSNRIKRITKQIRPVEIEKGGFLDGYERVSFLISIINWSHQRLCGQRSVDKAIMFKSNLILGNSSYTYWIFAGSLGFIYSKEYSGVRTVKICV